VLAGNPVTVPCFVFFVFLNFDVVYEETRPYAGYTYAFGFVSLQVKSVLGTKAESVTINIRFWRYMSTLASLI
jgi:hypothetical protein